MAAKEETGFRLTWKMWLAIFSVLVVIVFFAYFFGLLKKTCNDDACFNDALKSCSMARYLKLQNYNYYEYSIEGGRQEDCLLTVTLVKMALGTPQEKIDLFEGKGMACMVPKTELANVKSDTVEGILEYCTGPLKESMYQLIIEKLYTLIVANMGGILGEMSDVLAGKV